MFNNYRYPALIIILLWGCKERFEPNIPPVPQGYLVVEGFINAQGPSRIRLSRSTPLNQKATLKPELNASLWIEGDDNSSFTLSPQTNGFYSSVTLPLNPSRKYRLRIKTKDSKEYLSEFDEVKITPPIDSVSWQEDNTGVQIYVDTHDPQNKTLYYKYDFSETWAIQSAYFAHWRYVNGIIRESIAGVDPDVYNCWKYDSSTNILLASSAKLNEDIIHLNPLKFIPIKDDRLGIRYSIQVQQYALDKEGYMFLEQMKKNTESLGTIFDPQPSALRGNIQSVSDPNEIVIGYVNATTVNQKRIFINDSQIRGRRFSIHDICYSWKVVNHPDSIKMHIPPSWPYEPIYSPQGAIVAYNVAPSTCVDCRERRGVNVKPSFW